MLSARPAILLTGAPGSGKTTVIEKVIGQLPCAGGGFYTREIRNNDQRVGFEIVTLDGKTSILAHKSPDEHFVNEMSFGDFRVNLDAVDAVAVPSLVRAVESGQLIVVDEIAPMEIMSSLFCDTVLNLIRDSNLFVIGTIVKRSVPFADMVKSSDRVLVRPVTLANRDQLPEWIMRQVKLHSPSP